MDDDQDQEDLTEEQRASLATAYEILTSKYVKTGTNPTMIDDALEELDLIKLQRMKLAEIYNLEGVVADIFRALLVVELKNFDPEELILYIDYMHIPIEDMLKEEADQLKLSIFITNHHIIRMQRVRVRRYTSAVLFDTLEVREFLKPEVFHIQDYDDGEGIIPEEYDILEKSPNYWYPQIGDLSVDTIRNNFDFEEIFHLLMIVREQWNPSGQQWILSNLTRYDDVMGALFNTYRDLELDPRSYLTIDGPILAVLNEPHEGLLTLNHDAKLDHIELIETCLKEGITAFREGVPAPINLLFEEYVVAQLSRGFSSHFGPHRTLLQASEFSQTAGGIPVHEIDTEELVYYGVRDGMSKMTIYTLEELYHSFKNPENGKGGLGYHYDPFAIRKYPPKYPGDTTNIYVWEAFPRRTIIRLVESILPYKRVSAWSMKLAEACRIMLAKDEGINVMIRKQNSIIDNLMTADYETELSIKKGLMMMYNMGIQLMNYEDEINIYMDSAIDDMIIKDPSSFFPETIYTGRPQAECRDIIMEIQQAILKMGNMRHIFERLSIVKRFNGKFRVYYEDSSYEISNYLSIMHKMARYSMASSLILAGRWMMTTANYYHAVLYRKTLIANQLNIEFMSEAAIELKEEK